MRLAPALNAVADTLTDVIADNYESIQQGDAEKRKDLLSLINSWALEGVCVWMGVGVDVGVVSKTECVYVCLALCVCTCTCT